MYEQAERSSKDLVGLIAKDNRLKIIICGTLLATDNEGETYRLPDRYGWAPFLKFTFVLRKTFSKLGYQLQESIFDTDISFQKLCFIHNTIDCMVNNRIEYAQLLPDIELEKFLEFVENSFGCRFVIDEVQKTATPVFWKDLLVSSPVADLTPYYEDHEQINFSKPTFLHLTINRHIEETTSLKYQSFPEMFKGYGDYSGSYKNKAAMQADIDLEKLSPGVYFLQNSRIYVALEKMYVDPENSMGAYSFVITPLDKNTLDYYVPAQDTYETKSTGMNSVVLFDVPLSGKTDVRTSASVDVGFAPLSEMIQKSIDDLISKYSPEDGIISRIPLIKSIRHLNTVMETTTTENNQTTTTVEEESDVSLPIMLCQAHGRAKADPRQPGIEKTFFAASDAYDNAGNKLGSFDLSTFSLYENFWKYYDRLLQTSYTIGKAQMSFLM